MLFHSFLCVSYIYYYNLICLNTFVSHRSSWVNVSNRWMFADYNEGNAECLCLGWSSGESGLWAALGSSCSRARVSPWGLPQISGRICPWIGPTEGMPLGQLNRLLAWNYTGPTMGLEEQSSPGAVVMTVRQRSPEQSDEPLLGCRWWGSCSVNWVWGGLGCRK